ncbi:hypothetical protein C0J45_14948 [Silurus meridionalis]|nr:hypothetical protein C0J45_14948 [Silurus meridionalis]
MTRYTGEEALQMVLDSDEEFTFSSEEDCNFDEERLHFEEGIDPFEDFTASCYDENVAASPLPSLETHTRPCRRRSILSSTENHPECDQAPASKRAKAAHRQSTMSWKDQTDNDTVPQTLRFLPTQSVVSTLCHNTNAQAAKSIAKGRKYKWRDVTMSEMYRYIGLLFYMAMVKLPSIIDYW